MARFSIDGRLRMDIGGLAQTSGAILVAAAWRLLGAGALWLVGRRLITFALRVLRSALAREQFDPTLARYFQTGLNIILNVALVVAILGFFGVETTRVLTRRASSTSSRSSSVPRTG